MYLIQNLQILKNIYTLKKKDSDSRLHICAVMISYDIVPHILPIGLRKKLSFVYHYRIAHIAILVLAILAIPLALTNNYFMADQFSRFYGRLYAPIVVAPFILAVLGFRTGQPIVLMGMVAGALSVFAWRKWIYPLLGTTDGLFPCMLVNGLVILAVHYLWLHQKRLKEANHNLLNK
ncbi:hypothetical protein ACRRVB_04145 [Candidatus Cardinium hertigii]|uniref:hypothetical protein n=1 Tax=Candidatus Cardinium hertigii TaxID=247481 RepID=UPI003D7D8981